MILDMLDFPVSSAVYGGGCLAGRPSGGRIFTFRNKK